MRPTLSIIERIERLIYNAGIFSYRLIIHLFRYFNAKAKLFVLGRHQQQESLVSFRKEHLLSKVLWVHCASLGEFEQGRPIIERLKKQNPDLKIALTFFSPSGYELRKSYAYADWIGYLPMDTPHRARKFFQQLQPTWGVIVKYEFWLNHLIEAQKNEIPLYLVGAVFRPKQIFFTQFGGLFRKVLKGFKHLFVQDIASMKLLESIGITNVSIAGDPRIDSVIQQKASNVSFPKIEAFLQAQPTFIIGSSWINDIEVLLDGIDLLINQGWKVIIAPHDISPKNIKAHTQLLSGRCTNYSELGLTITTPILIIDNIGMLSSLYQYGRFAYIGGGFGEGIHSTLEPAAYDLPLLFGPRYKKFLEAVYFVQHEGAFCVHSKSEAREVIEHLTVAKNRIEPSEVIHVFMEQNKGSTDIILQQIKMKI